MDETRKERIIGIGIVAREDWDRLAPEHVALADFILAMLDLQKTHPDLEMFSDESFKSEDEQAEELLEFLQRFNDIVELEEIDRVRPDKTFEAGMPIAIPTSLAPMFKKILQEGP